MKEKNVLKLRMAPDNSSQGHKMIDLNLVEGKITKQFHLHRLGEQYMSITVLVYQVV